MKPKGPPRKFDWDTARELRNQGWTYQRIANLMGVSYARIYQICNPETHARVTARVLELQRSGTCVHCGAQCSTSYSRHLQGRCRQCANLSKITTVRDAELLCCSCRNWKPDEAFPHNATLEHRRHRHRQCTQCGTIAKRAYRRRSQYARRSQPMPSDSIR